MANKVITKNRQNNNRPRLTVFRSNKYIYAQLIDDNKGIVLASANSRQKDDEKDNRISRVTIKDAERIGREIGKIAKKKKIDKAIFDRRSYKYHGRIKTLVESARKEGLVI